VYVSRKLSLYDVPERQVIPANIGAVETDVINVELTFTPHGKGRGATIGDYDGKPAPGEPGSSIGLDPNTTRHLGKVVSGTLGAILNDDVAKKKYLMSCNHVLSVNGYVQDQKGILSPGPQDLKAAAITIPISSITQVPLKHDERNLVDCAVAEIDLKKYRVSDGSMKFRRDSRERALRVEGKPMKLEPIEVATAVPPKIGQRVFKLGKSTGLTYGTIVDTSADILVDYSFGVFHFTDQVLIEGDQQQEFAADGDSGSVVLTDTDAPVAVAMVLAPAGRLTAACSMPLVKERLIAVLKPPPRERRGRREGTPFNLNSTGSPRKRGR
jgi:hypothetical protein